MYVNSPRTDLKLFPYANTERTTLLPTSTADALSHAHETELCHDVLRGTHQNSLIGVQTNPYTHEVLIKPSTRYAEHDS